jgi:hypothetical protein
MPKIDPAGIYQLDELSGLIGVPRKALAICCERGDLPSTKVNKRRLVRGQAVFEWLTRREVSHPAIRKDRSAS